MLGPAHTVVYLTVKSLLVTPTYLYDRGLAFTCQALQNMQSDPSCELHVCFKRSYDTVLRHHHTFLIRSVVSASDTYLSEKKRHLASFTGGNPCRPEA